MGRGGELTPGEQVSRLNDLVRNEARRLGVPANQVRRQWVVKTFLVALFLHDPDGWLLKGGTGMMVRLPEARHSKDVDLATAMEIDAAVTHLREALAVAPGPYRWEVQSKRAMVRAKAGMSLTVTAMIGSTAVDSFNIDLATQRELVGAVEHYRVSADPSKVTGGVEAMVALVPLADQAADKICAMHEAHGTEPSNRLRDLIDLLLIQLHLAPRLCECATAVAAEAARRGLVLPTELSTATIPAAIWAARWPAAVNDSPLPEAFADIGVAVAAAGRCWGPVLAARIDVDAVADAVWDPAECGWRPL